MHFFKEICESFFLGEGSFILKGVSGRWKSLLVQNLCVAWNVQKVREEFLKNEKGNLSAFAHPK